jgi:hypothetical protein
MPILLDGLAGRLDGNWAGSIEEGRVMVCVRHPVGNPKRKV